MDDGDSITYIADDDAEESSTIACQGYPNLISAGESLMESVMDTFEDVVEDQKWFRFLKTKYDSFNHLDEDGTVTLMTMLSDEDMTINTWETLQKCKNAKAEGRTTEQKEEGYNGNDYGNDNETVLTDEAESIVDVPRNLQQKGFRGPAEMGNFTLQKESYRDLEEERERDEKEEQDDGDEYDEDSEEESYTVRGEAGEVETLEEGEDCEVETILATAGDDEQCRSHSQVELDRQGPILHDTEDTMTVSTLHSISSILGKRVVDACAYSIQSFPSMEEQDGVNQSCITKPIHGEILTTPSSSGLEVNAISYSTPPAFGLHSRKASKESHASRDSGSNNTVHTAQTSHGSRSIDQEDDQGAHASVEVVGVEKRRPLGFFRFWRMGLSKLQKEDMSRKKQQGRKNGTDRPKKQTSKTVAQPFVTPHKTRETSDSLQRPIKERKLPKTTVIVTRNSDY
ncbi:hypothetical protein IV203_007774 [Nitzschia inconspicua]|uniref:Uncharacterized protein n=1 Tax=Nitzschia inconspicua TaxID=303405 RepID=A0A9K3KXZ0_9STRA|nr:hypothetical protein IV203_007774 [Nitzschia inconspicua]